MATRNVHHVYKGSVSLQDFIIFQPDRQPMMPMVELPRNLNPFYEDGVRIYAKMMSTLPANSVKSLQLCETRHQDHCRVPRYSSGSTVISMSLIARALCGIIDTRPFLSNNTSWTNLQLIVERRWSTPTSTPTLNEMNWKAHFRWTDPQILTQLPEINVFCCGMGTSGTMTGVGTYLKEAKPRGHRLFDVCTKAGDGVPCPRSFALMSPVEFPWRAAVDTIEEVGSPECYRLCVEMTALPAF
ncbi:hypothetical protein KVR01_005189 [Diaporthe batatas]|uniref:uncharacterized protein n=1 Tax=Diaporthe batatas TaxID=748121 RepID=UPI001D03EACA|nr:uncharacterized protein KVR01_005189 [Diaporthe batatas]KAG8164914.1 hypothetical protein KVR01_005189 [Diaporthe batatas]